MRLAVKFAYDGVPFHGYQRQPHLRTVEDEIISCLQKARIIDDVRESGFKSGSRTDKGVSAIGNVLAFDTDFNPGDVAPAHNAYSRDVWFLSVTEVDDHFHPRSASCRWYRYHLRRRKSLDALRRVAGAFVGEHDFKSFSRARSDTVRTIDVVDIRQERDFTVIDIRGRSFLWQMVRRMIGAIVGYECGEVDMKTICRALEGEKLAVKPAPPEPLFLMDVQHDDVEFRIDPRIRQKVIRDLTVASERAALKKELYETVKRTIRSRARSQERLYVSKDGHI
ncbi:MAG: tRNA pseudouridine(38-40) synthase TruA [Thermoplasmata archaeon]